MEPDVSIETSSMIRIAVLPVGEIHLHLFSKYAGMLGRHHKIELSTITSFYKVDVKSPFLEQPWDSGRLRFKFIVGGSPPSPWEDFQSNRKIHGVIGICQCPSSSNLESVAEQFAVACKGYLSSVVQSCFVFFPWRYTGFHPSALNRKLLMLTIVLLIYIQLLKNGVYPTRGQIYVKTHTRKQGKKVPEKVTQVLASLTVISSDSTTQDPFDFSNDDYFEVKGPKKRGGYIRCVGRMPTQNASSSTNPKNEDLSQMNLVGNKSLMNLVGYMASIIQDLAPNEDLSKILKNMNIQMPNRTSTVNQRSSESGFTCQGQPEESV